MKYIKLFEMVYPEVPFGDILVNEKTKSYEKVSNFITYYKLDPNILNIWNSVKQQYNEYPSKIDTKEVLYISQDGAKLILKLKDGKINSMEKISMDYIDLYFKPVIKYKGEYTWQKFNELFRRTVMD